VSANGRRRAGTLARKVFEILLAHPEGLYFREILRLLQEPQLPDDGSDNLEPPACSSEEVASSCVAAFKAGWLFSRNDVFVLSPHGVEAYARYKDPEQFMIAAARLSVRGWLSVYFPKYYSFAAKVKDRFAVEYRLARRMGLRRLARQVFAQATPWQDLLPIQRPRRLVIPGVEYKHFESLLRDLRSLGLSYGEGRNAIYLPPETLKKSAFRILAEMYPPNAGLKLVKNQGAIEDVGYLAHYINKDDSVIQSKLVHHLRHLTLVANLLYSKGVGPRLYDLVELQCGTHVWTAYVSEHVNGTAPSIYECEAVIHKLRDLERQGLLTVILPDGFDDEEFTCPTCSGNALLDRDRNCKYVDFQNFLLLNYQSFLTDIAAEASTSTHFGDELLLRGGRYLYQSVPGVTLPSKRNVDERLAVITRLMESAGASVRDRLVLDVGCNIGMMMAQYLKLGAQWCHGWDRAYVIPYTEHMLLALGCTRFSTSGVDITQAQRLEEDLPSFLMPSLNGCIISYLAVRGHLGWLDALSRIPWSLLIYEGHEGESQKEFEDHMSQLRRLTDFQVGEVSSYVDGDSEQRTVALLLRKCV
jgi:hypothetical protein